MAITLQCFAFITKYVAHFVAKSLLFATVAITQFLKNAQNGPFSQLLSHKLAHSVSSEESHVFVKTTLLVRKMQFF